MLGRQGAKPSCRVVREAAMDGPLLSCILYFQSWHPQALCYQTITSNQSKCLGISIEVFHRVVLPTHEYLRSLEHFLSVFWNCKQPILSHLIVGSCCFYKLFHAINSFRDSYRLLNTIKILKDDLLAIAFNFLFLIFKANHILIFQVTSIHLVVPKCFTFKIFHILNFRFLFKTFFKWENFTGAKINYCNSSQTLLFLG